MMLRIALLLLLLWPSLAHAALSAATVWEVRTTGSDNNGGGFVAGASGTDRSQQDAAQTAYTDLVLATTTTLTSAGNPFSSADVGNILNITGGSGFTTGRYQIVSVSVATATIDRVGGTGGSTGGTGNLGGALATIATAASSLASGNDVWVKATANYAITTGISFSTAGVDATDPVRIMGYTSTRGDNGRATITSSSAISFFTLNNNFQYAANFILTGSGSSTLNGFVLNGASNTIKNVKVSGIGDGAGNHYGIIALSVDNVIEDFEVSGMVSGSPGVIATAARNTFIRGYIHDFAATGLTLNSNTTVEDVIVDSLSGASSDCISVTSTTRMISINGVVAYNCGRDGIRLATVGQVNIRNAILSTNGGYGINVSAGGEVGIEADYNGYYNNTTAARNNLTAGAHDVTLSADPFTDAANADFTLNNTAGGGAALRGVGTPGTLPGL